MNWRFELGETALYWKKRLKGRVTARIEGTDRVYFQVPGQAWMWSVREGDLFTVGRHERLKGDPKKDKPKHRPQKTSR